MGLNVRAIDMTYGKPAVGVDMTISRMVDAVDSDLIVTKTNPDGRACAWPGNELERGIYRLKIDVSAYFSTTGVIPAYQSALTTFRVPDAEHRYEIEFSISPYGCLITFNSEPM